MPGSLENCLGLAWGHLSLACGFLRAGLGAA